jgi:integrase
MPRHAAHFRIKLRGPVYQVRFTRHGKEHRLSTDTGDKGRAKQEAERLVRNHDIGNECRICGGGGAPVGHVSVRELSERFLKECLRTHGAAYQKRATTDMVQYIEEKWKDPNEITSKAWEEAKIDWHTQPTERRERLSWGSIANLANTLRAFVRFCAGLGVVDSVPELRNPTTKQLASDRAYLRPLVADERGAFLWALAIAGEARALRIYIALFETWMRKGELGHMTPRWIDFSQETILIPARHSKNGHSRKIDLTPRAAEAIRAEMEASDVVDDNDSRRYADAVHGDHGQASAGPAQALERAGSHGKLRDRVCDGDQQGGLRQARVVDLDEPIFGSFDYRSLFPRIAEAAGIDLTGLTAHHVTRRTAATLAGEKPGASLAALKSQGGWRTSSVVDLYMKPSVEAARRVTR